MPSQTSVVILGGGIGRRFGCLTSGEAPKALLPLANAPLISFPVEWVCAAGLREATVVVGASACLAAAVAARFQLVSLLTAVPHFSTQPATLQPQRCSAG